MTDDKSQEERIAALEAELAALRKPAPKPEPFHRTIEGQGQTPIDRSGNRIVPPATPSETTVGGSGGFGTPYREGPDGTRVWAPDGVPRDPRTGEPLSGVSPGSMGTGPVRNVQHAQAVDHLDRMFPIQRVAPKE